MSKSLVSQSLLRAVAAKRPQLGLIYHSDRGSQYCAHEYRNILERFGMKVSMSQKGNCYDNAPVESFWGTLKNELVHRIFMVPEVGIETAGVENRLTNTLTIFRVVVLWKERVISRPDCHE